MKGIILAGGTGTRLHPITKAISKQLLPVYDKPMIYYPLSTLMLAGIKEILIISTEYDLSSYKRLLGTGEDIGVKFDYKAQKEPNGLAEAFIIGEDFLGSSPCALVLGDNIFYGHDFIENIKNIGDIKDGACIFGCRVDNSRAFGVIEIDKDNNPISIEEKPENPQSPYAVPGIYFYDNKVAKIAKTIKPSYRGELEITDINKHYLKQGTLRVIKLARETAWLDTGTYANLREASAFVEMIQKKHGFYVGCIEEVAFNLGYIDRNQLKKLAETMEKTDYGQYLLKIANNTVG